MTVNRIRSGLLALALLAAGSAWAQTWPSGPIRLVVPFPPGGSVDMVARAVGKRLSDALGQPVVVDNRAGASGDIAAEFVARSAPDGQTLFVTSSGVLAANQFLYKRTGFDSLKDFAPVIRLANQPNILMVHPSIPAKSVQELVALAKAQPGKVTMGHAGVGTGQHIAAQQFSSMSGVSVLQVPYKGGAPAMTDLIGRQIPAAITALSSAMPHLRAGRVRALATTARARLADLPEVATFSEAGFAQLVATTWFSLSGPAGMPPNVVALLNSETRRAMNSAKWRERLQGEGIEPNNLDAAAFTQFVRAEVERWTPLARAAQPES